MIERSDDIRHRVRIAAALIALAMVVPGFAATRTWPGPIAPCNGTLQSCIDGSASGDTVQIATATPIDEDIFISDRGFTLTAAPGWSPQFAYGRRVAWTGSASAGSLQFAVSRLHFYAGGVDIAYAGSGTATVDVRELTVDGDPGNPAYSASINVSAPGGSVVAMLYGNRLRHAQSGILLSVNGGSMNATALYNRIDGVLGNGVPFMAQVLGNDTLGRGGSGTFVLDGNTVIGAPGAAFSVAELPTSGGLNSAVSATLYNNVAVCGAPNNSSPTGFDLYVSNGSVGADLVNNSTSLCETGIRLRGSGVSTGSISGSAVNNLVVASTGLSIDAARAPSFSNDYNLVNATTNAATLGAHSVTAPAQLVADVAPRLRAGSPAIDAAHAATLALGIAFHSLPLTDADGLRRFRRAAGSADIGAYAYGDATFTQGLSSSNTTADTTSLDNAAVNGVPGALPLATYDANAGATTLTEFKRPFGADYLGARWALYDEAVGNGLPLGGHFNVWAPGPGPGSFAHVTSVTSTSGADTQIVDSETDNRPDRIVLVLHNRSAGPSGVYLPSPIGVSYGADAHWHIDNLDGATMPRDIGFSVYAQDTSPNAFRLTASAVNLVNGDLQLDHPLLTGTPCARPQVTRVRGAGMPQSNFDLRYDPAGYGHWYVHAYDGISIGDAFHVLVDPAQVFECTDRLFADGFEAP